MFRLMHEIRGLPSPYSLAFTLQIYDIFFGFAIYIGIFCYNDATKIITAAIIELMMSVNMVTIRDLRGERRLPIYLKSLNSLRLHNDMFLRSHVA